MKGGNNFRIIPIVAENGRQTERNAEAVLSRFVVGHWEGDTLVVDVTNFNGKPWLGNAQPPNRLPQTSSDALHVIERWSRPDATIFEYQVVVEDSKMLTAPWTGSTSRRGMLPYDSVEESLCFLDPELDARHKEYAAEQAKKRGTR
jgi:hypothetical protein